MSKRSKASVRVKVAGAAKVTVTLDTRETSPRGLVFGKGNAKLKGVHTFSLPAGWACPGARDCLTRADRDKGKLKDGPDTVFRCFSASQEAMFPTVRRARWRNFDALTGKTAEQMTGALLAALPGKATKVRIHVSGDFFSQAYFDAWCAVARARPGVLFYAYTKSLPYWVARLGTIPQNLVLTASRGGRHDALIGEHELRSAVVVYSVAEAEAAGLEIDEDDTHAMRQGPSFALLLHGMQPPGSEASKALQRLRNEGEFGYGRKADERRKALPVV